MRQELRRRGVEADLFTDAKLGEIDDRDGAPGPIADEAVSAKPGGFGRSAGERSGRRQKQAPARDQGSGHFFYSTAVAMLF
jgi:hypothetical protein